MESNSLPPLARCRRSTIDRRLADKGGAARYTVRACQSGRPQTPRNRMPGQFSTSEQVCGEPLQYLFGLGIKAAAMGNLCCRKILAHDQFSADID